MSGALHEQMVPGHVGKQAAHATGDTPGSIIPALTFLDDGQQAVR